MTDYKKLYETNSDFKTYVDRYCNSLRHKKTPEEAFKDITVQSYADYLKVKIPYDDVSNL